MTKISLAALLALALLVTGAGAAKPVYSMADLEALASQESWEELAERLGDIVPSARGAAWTALAERAGLAALDDTDADRGLERAQALLKRYPIIKKSNAFMRQRAEKGLAGFKRCFARAYDGSSCLEGLRAFVADDSANADLAWKAGKLARLRAGNASAVTFFAAASLSKAADERCKDDDLRLAVLAGLSLPRDSDGVIVERSLELASGPCFESLKGALKDNFSAGEYYQRNVCGLLISQKLVAGLQAKICARRM